jgi:hypothetical protein
MSYGRDPSMLRKVGGFRQMGGVSMQKPKTKNAGGGGGGGALRWHDKYAPSMIRPDTVRLLRNEHLFQYVPMDEEDNPLHFDPDGRPQVWESVESFVKFVEHRSNRTERTEICSAGPLRDFWKYRDPCLGCDDYFNGWKALREQYAGGKVPSGKRPSMGKREMWAMSVLHYATYHKAPQTDAKGQVKKNPNTNEPYMEWTPCLRTYGYQCPHCTANRETKLGHVGHWPMGKEHWNVIVSLDSQVGDSCSNCGGIPQNNTPCIQSSAWLCPNCDEAVIDLNTTEHTPEEIVKMTTSHTVCPHCSQLGLLTEYISCINCANPKRATLFDVDINFMRVKQGSGDSERTVLQPSQWSPPRPIDPNFLGIAQALDLPKIYGATPLDVQAKSFQLPLPAALNPAAQGQQPAPLTAAEAARPYGSAPPMGGPAMPGGANGMYKP